MTDPFSRTKIIDYVSGVDVNSENPNLYSLHIDLILETTADYLELIDITRKITKLIEDELNMKLKVKDYFI